MCWHKWGKWETIKSGNINNGYGITIAYYVTQQKTCELCGKVRVRNTKTY